MNTYLVKIKILTGGYEKSTDYIVEATNQRLAMDFAIHAESHNTFTLNWNDPRGISDMDGEFIYQPSAEKISDCDVDALKKYIPAIAGSPVELLESGNYAMVRHLKTKVRNEILGFISKHNADTYIDKCMYCGTYTISERLGLESISIAQEAFATVPFLTNDNGLVEGCLNCSGEAEPDITLEVAKHENDELLELNEVLGGYTDQGEPPLDSNLRGWFNFGLLTLNEVATEYYNRGRTQVVDEEYAKKMLALGSE